MKRPSRLKGLPTLRDLPNLRGTRVFVRVDFNLPHDEKGRVKDDTRIVNTLPTLNYLLDQGATLILAAHHSKKDQSLRPAAKRFEQLIKKPVSFINEFWTTKAIKQIRKAKPGTIIMLENTRFHQGEKKNDPDLAKHFAQMADWYVNDAFGVAHRAHVSTVGLADYLPGAIGFLMEKEVVQIQETMQAPEHPFVAIIGGSKISTKLGMINKLLDAADTVLLGGGVANTFFRAWGVSVGKSLVDEEMVETARAIFWKATRQHTAMILPEDVKTTHAVLNNDVVNVHHQAIHPDHTIADIGDQTCRDYYKIIIQAKTIVWNGPLGVYEDKRFRDGTKSVFKAVVESKGRSIVGGGDTIASIPDPQLRKKITHISTGGGAMLELIEKGTLPALEALKDSSW